ncbi:hypothetical protein [Amycolatopsis sp. H20-H5]|uniref:hypothetical protein n=1 Tax=Amycolatopsis sp. H20-H5 TaxID=3046309 RepID=UPI002DBA73CA|nr:hypothetical protein [Amycolatopsis sp. H20-H5]MEC3980404.1 hypothetical protein [Amycolatopsis sp. H20-H5]
MSTPEPKHAYPGDLVVQIRRLTKLLESTVERLEAVESLQAVTVGEQQLVVEELERQTERLRLVVEQRHASVTRETLAVDDTLDSGYSPF